MMTCIDPSFGSPRYCNRGTRCVAGLAAGRTPASGGEKGDPDPHRGGPNIVLRCFPIRKTAACILTQRFSQCNPPSPGIRHGIPELKAVAVTKQSPIVYPDACNGALKQASFSL